MIASMLAIMITEKKQQRQPVHKKLQNEQAKDSGREGRHEMLATIKYDNITKKTALIVCGVCVCVNVYI